MSGSTRAAGPSVDRAWLAVGVLTAIAFALRVPHIGESLVGDEMYAYAEVHGRTFWEVFQRVQEGGENSPPLFFALAWFTMKLGDPTVTIRIPSLLLGTGVVPLVYLLGLRTVGRRAALLGALLVTLAPFAIYYSSEARPYGTLMFTVTASTLLLLLALDTGRARWWVLYAVTGCLALYAHYFAVFPLIAQGAWALAVHRSRVRELALVYAGIFVGYLPWLVVFLNQKGNSISILAFYAPLTWKGAGRELLRLFPGHPSFQPSDLPGTTVVLLVWLAVAAAAAAALVTRAGGRPLPVPASRLVLVGLLVVATPIGFTIYSATGPEVFIGRYLSAALPVLCLAIGAALAYAPRAVGVAATLVIAAGLAYGAVRSLDTDNRRPAYKAAAHYIDDAARPDDAVVQLDLTLGASKSQVTTGGRQLSLDVNFDREHDLFSVFEENDVVGAYRRAARRPRFLLVGPAPLPAPPAGLKARLVDRRDFAGLLPLEVALYAPADPARGFGTGGLAQAEQLARQRAARARQVRDCLERDGLPTRPAETSPPGSIAVEVPLAGGARAIVDVYESPERAAAELPAIQRFLEGSGGQALQAGRHVVVYTGGPPAEARRRVEACL
jgi:Dolichyl-phosphate-mannose-protein mannosyltransferase